MSKLFSIDPSASPSPLSAVIWAKLLNIDITWSIGIPGGVEYAGKSAIPDALIDACQEDSIPVGVEFDRWMAFCKNELSSKSYPDLIDAFKVLDDHLRMRMFMSGCTGPSLIDILVYCQLKATAIWGKCIKEGKGAGEDVVRWYSYLASLSTFQSAHEELFKQAASLKSKPKDQASYAIELVGAEQGKVVTRFPPEPSGFMHIGHAKAVLLNQYFAQSYNGKMIIRFDDTNPLKENTKFEEGILEDLALIGVKGDVMSRTSDYFPQCEAFAEQMISEELAYCDDTPQEQMREQRFSGTESACRNNPAGENMRRWEEMKKGSEEGLRNCLRAKIGMSHANKALRDPVIYRCQLAPHHATGTKYKIYPTYDFACPVVDSLEGVTHALRTNEYHDRNDQYYWIIDALRLRKPQIWDYSRLSFVYTLLGKRKMSWMVSHGRVAGWDDPRLPTIRGIRRRGLTVPALKEYILMQGPSKNTVLLEWDKLWAVNKKHIDPVAPRFTALDKQSGLVKVVLVDGPEAPYLKELPKHKKNPDIGVKQTAFSKNIFIEQSDAQSIKPGEEVTLMDWGNVFFLEGETITDESGQIIQMSARLNLQGDFKKTEKKITWLSPDPNYLVPLILHDYDYLITKKKIEEEDNLEDHLTPVTEFITLAVGDANMGSISKGDILQLERKGYYICDASREESADGSVHLIFIPDGKSKSLASKHQA